ncbi:MAG: hypothetical protein KDK51_00825 [Deltaproteobacteria bacterium]|nr:hypothetical protein [Deltaproteobacteria bacterium]
MGHALFALFALVLTACQQPLQAPEPRTTTTVIETSNELELCPDGTLNCYIEFPNPTVVETIVHDPIDAYTNCMDQCLQAQSCNVSPFSLTSAQTQCTANAAGSTDVTQYGACDQMCSVVMNHGGSIGFETDPMAIPEHSKAITVRIKSCIDQRATHFQFKGPNMATRKFHQGHYRTKGTDFFGFGDEKVRLPYQVGTNSACPDAYRGQAKVTFTPYKEQDPFPFSADIAVDTIAFSDLVEDEINLQWKAPHLTSAQIPRELIQELDLSQMVWMLKKIHTPNPTVNLVDYIFAFNPFNFNFEIPTFFSGFGYASNGQPFGDSIVYIAPTFDEALISDFSMVLFVKAKE